MKQRDKYRFFKDELDQVSDDVRGQIGILACCEGLLETYRGYIWRYKEDDPE